MSRRVDRRHFAILGVLAERGRVLSDVVSNELRRNHVGVVNDLVWLEIQGRVVGDRVEPGGEARRRFYRLATDAERWTRGVR